LQLIRAKKSKGDEYEKETLRQKHITSAIFDVSSF